MCEDGGDIFLEVINHLAVRVELILAALTCYSVRGFSLLFLYLSFWTFSGDVIIIKVVQTRSSQAPPAKEVQHPSWTHD